MSYIKWIRSKVGRRKIFLPFASVILQDDQDRILLQRRNDFDIWGLPGGVMELGENILSCARRELMEETGLTAGELRLVGLYSEPKYDVVYPNGDQVQQYTLCFQGLMKSGEMRVDGLENSAQIFLDYDEIPFDQVPIWYADMLHDFKSSAQPTFEPPFAEEFTYDQIQDIRPLIGPAVYQGVGSGAVVVNQEGHLLLAQRTDNSYWHFPGGYMHIGENAAHAVVRELKEETGLEITPECILGVHSPKKPWVYPNGDQVQGLVTFFLSRLDDSAADTQIHPDQVETIRAVWVPPEQVMAYNTHPSMKVIHQAILEYLEKGYFIL